MGFQDILSLQKTTTHSHKVSFHPNKTHMIDKFIHEKHFDRGRISDVGIRPCLVSWSEVSKPPGGVIQLMIETAFLAQDVGVTKNQLLRKEAFSNKRLLKHRISSKLVKHRRIRNSQHTIDNMDHPIFGHQVRLHDGGVHPTTLHGQSLVVGGVHHVEVQILPHVVRRRPINLQKYNKKNSTKLSSSHVVLVVLHDVVHEEYLVRDDVQLQQLLESLPTQHHVPQVAVVPGGVAGREKCYVLGSGEVVEEPLAELGVLDHLAEFAERAVFFFLFGTRSKGESSACVLGGRISGWSVSSRNNITH